MLPRRMDVKTPDPPEEMEMPRRRGRQLPDPPGPREMHQMRARLDAMELAQRRTVSAGDISESKSEDEVGHGGEQVATKDAANKCLLRVITRMGAREKMDIPVYEKNLDVEELLD